MPTPIDPELYEEAKRVVYAQYKKPSAYRSGALQKKYKELGGRYAGKKTSGKLYRWFQEEWTDIGGKEYPVYRPTKRITKETPLTIDEIDPVYARRQIQLKQYLRGERNLPPFK